MAAALGQDRKQRIGFIELATESGFVTQQIAPHQQIFVHGEIAEHPPAVRRIGNSERDTLIRPQCIDGLATKPDGATRHHFLSKEEIVSEILDQGHRRCLSEVSKGIEALGPAASNRQILKTAILIHIGCLLGEDSFPSANIRIFAHVPQEVRMASLGVRHEYESFWMRLLKKCQDSGDSDKEIEPAVLAYLLFGAMNWTLEWYKPGRYNIEEIAENLVRLIFSNSISYSRKGSKKTLVSTRSRREKSH